jgi:hypothetical protein
VTEGLTIEARLHQMADLVPSLINRFTVPGPHCVLATTVGQMLLARFGIRAEPYSVSVMICNEAWVQWDAAKRPGGVDEQMRRGAYLLSNQPHFEGTSFNTGQVPPDKAWDGHLVLKVVDGAKTWLVDLDLGSFNRPAHHIHLPGGIVAPLSKAGAVTGVYEDEAGYKTTVAYWPMTASYAHDYMTAKDWVDRDRFTRHVAAMERVLRRGPP